MGTVSQQNLNYLDQKLSNVVSEIVRFLEMFFKNDPAAFDDLVIEYEISLDRIVSHEFLALVKVGNVVLKIIDECFGVKVRDDVPDFIVLL